MHIESFRTYCLQKPGVEEGFPFGPDTLVFKVGGKMFALAGLDSEELRVNLKCEPEKAQELRAQFPDAVLPGYHMNKKHWNTVRFESEQLSEALLLAWIDHSYDLVRASLKKSIRDELGL